MSRLSRTFFSDAEKWWPCAGDLIHNGNEFVPGLDFLILLENIRVVVAFRIVYTYIQRVDDFTTRVAVWQSKLYRFHDSTCSHRICGVWWIELGSDYDLGFFKWSFNSSVKFIIYSIVRKSKCLWINAYIVRYRFVKALNSRNLRINYHFVFFSITEKMILWKIPSSSRNLSNLTRTQSSLEESTIRYSVTVNRIKMISGGASRTSEKWQKHKDRRERERARDWEGEKKHSRFYSFSPAFSSYFCSRLVTLSSVVDVHEISPSLEVLLLSVQIVSSYDLKTKTETEIKRTSEY